MLKNRGAISNLQGRFEKDVREDFDDGWNLKDPEEDDLPPLETILYPDPSKSIISRNKSPDIGFEQSINPYKGCEHGCIYCYARPSHAYMNLSPGLDFETKIFFKADASQLLEKEINKKNYICKPIVIGANTDPYQPAESQLKITRSLLEVLYHYQHPAIIITKGSLIERDLDILEKMSEKGLMKIAMTITTLSMELKRILEPRAAAPKARLRMIHHLSSKGIPVRVMVAPIIPFITDFEMEQILKNAALNGAQHASYTLIRLPHEVKDLFKEWLAEHFPERANHVMNIIRDMRGGKDYDAIFGKRMHGEGEYAHLLASRFKVACKKFNLNTKPSTDLNTNLFKKMNVSNQLDLFDD
jgi:DNA repair photolyase